MIFALSTASALFAFWSGYIFGYSHGHTRGIDYGKKKLAEYDKFIHEQLDFYFPTRT